MADKDLSVGIGVDLEVNTKKLDAIAKHIGMTGDKLQEALNFEVDTTSLEILGKEIGVLEAKAVSLGVTLASALGGNPAGQQELLNNLRDQLTVANKIKEASAQTAAPRKTGSQVGIKQAIAQELFGDKGADFNVGAFKSDLQSRAKGYLDDLGDDAIDLVDIAADTTKGLLQDINGAAQEAAGIVGVQFKSSTEMLTGFNGLSLKEDAAILETALLDLSEGFSLSGDRLVNGQRVLEQDLVNSIRDFEVDANGVFTISPAMFLDGYRRVIAKIGADLVTANSTDYKDMSFKPLEGKAPGQAGQNVVDYMQKTLDEIAAKPGGSAKIDQKLADLEEKIILEILEQARRAGERALKDPNEFNSRMLDTYAPSADTAAIAGSADTTNLERYADQEAAKVASQLEQLYGLAEGTIAAYVKVFSQDDSDPNKLFDMVRAARAIVGSSFTDATGTNVPSATSRGLVSGQGQTIGQQIVSNPAILQSILGVQQEAFDKKVETLLASRIKDQGGLAPGDLEQAIQLALIQSLAGQIARIKISPTEVATAVAEQTSTASGAAAPAVVSEQPAPAEAAKTQTWIQKLAETVAAAKAEFDQQGGVLMAALDTEFNPALKQAVSELSLNIMTASGEVVDLLSFIHVPFDKEALALERSKTGAKSVEDLVKRAKLMGLDMEKLGDIEDSDKNFMQLRAKVNALVSVLSMLDNLGVGLTGSNFKGAERANITKLIEYVNKQSAERGLGSFQVPGSLSTPFDSAREFKRAAPNSKEISLITDGGKVAGLGPLIEGINRHFPEFLNSFKDFFLITKEGPRVLSKTGEMMPAHYAQADVVMSQIVKAFYDKYAGSVARTDQIVKNVKSSVPAAPSVPTPPGGGGPSAPIGNQPPADLTGYFHTTREMEEQLASRKSLTQDERFLIEKKLELLKKDGEQVTTAKQLVGVQTKIAELRTADAIKARSLASKDLSPSQRQQTLPGFIGPVQNNSGVQSIRQFNELREQESALLSLGRAREAQVIKNVLAETRYKDVKEKDVLSTRKQIDAIQQQGLAGKQFSAQIQAQLKAQIESQKALQAAARNQTNQWVTARYALYDVGNFYQNLSQQLFGFTRQILNTTEAYKKFETAFTPVERAMQLATDASLDMRNQFIGLSEVLPVTFEDLSKIATLGAQMGISAGGIKQFTQTVAEFSAITSISADTVAQKFGRIAELANIDSSQFANLGSAVAYAGINAVATEAEILTLAESIAAASEQSGFMPEEIIGMSTALASVGIQAEQARGVFTRVFADIDRSVSRGGSELDAFAKASGMSAEDFSAQWGTAGQTYNVFRRLLGGLGGGADLTKTFDSLNIVETREVNTLTRLANNLNVVDRAVSDANSSYSEGIFLSQSFEKTVDNLDSQLVIFKNNVDSFSASFGKTFGIVLKDALATGSEFLKFLKGASESPFAQTLLPAAAALTAIGGTAALATAGFSKLIAQIYAFRVAQINGMNDSGAEINKVSSRLKQLTGAYSDLIEVRGGLRGVATVEDKGIVTPVTYDAGSQLKSQKDALADFAKNRDLASARNIANLGKQNDLLKSSNILLVTASNGSKAAIQDARAQADSIQRVIENQKAQNAAMVDRFNIDDLGQAKLANKKFFVEIINNEAVAISRGTVAELDNQIASAKATGQKNLEAEARRRNIKEINQETVTATTAATSFGSKAVNLASKLLGFASVAVTIASAIGILITAVDEANKIKLLDSGGGLQSLRDAIGEDTKVWKENGEAISTAKVEYVDYSAASYLAYDAIVGITGANSNLKKTSGEVTETLKSQTVAIGENTKQWMLNAIVGNEKVNTWFKENPGMLKEAEAGLNSYGTSFSELIQSVLKDPTGGGQNALTKVDAAAKKLQTSLSAITIAYQGQIFYKDPAEAKRLQAQIDGLGKIKVLISEMGGGLSEALDMSSFMTSMKSALGITEETDAAVQDLTASVKTLTQFASEVGQVMQAAFDFRYGKITALDNIRKAWSDLRKKADDARKAVKKAQDQLNSLKANRTVLEYQFSIAIKYGDSKRAAELQAKLDENTTSAAEAGDQLAEAQKNLSTDLRSGSDAAIQNRSTMSGLVQTYIPYLQALLNSGKSQKDVAKDVDALKAEFKKQATEIGFADADLVGYVGTFDLYKKVVKDMPNTVTVSIKGLDAAARAMVEFANAVNGMRKDPIIDPVTLAALTKAAERTEAIAKYRNLAVESSILEKRIGAGALSTRAVDQLSGLLNGIKAQMTSLDKKYSLVNPYSGQMNAYATGGYVSGPGTGTSDSIPARLSNGEYVMSAKTVATYGVDFMNSLNQSRVMYAPAQSSAGQAGGGSSVVYLSPDDRALLRAAIDRPVNLYANGTRLAQSVNDGNKVLAQRGSI